MLVHRLAPRLARSAAHAVEGHPVEAADIRRRLAYSRHVFETIDLFVAPSASMRDEFVGLGAPADRIQVSDYGFALIPAQPQRCPTAGEPLRIGFVGSLVWHKGVHLLIEAVRGLDGPWEVHIHGDVNVSPEYVGRLRHAAAGAPVTFHGGFARDRAAEVYRSFDLLVVPSLWPENSPLVIHEAFMHGLPVVAARMGGVPELVTHGGNGLLYDAFSTVGLRSCLQQLVQDRALVETLAGAGLDVKTIETDALEWNARYEQVTGRTVPSVAAVR